ncbi:MAG: excinuclease ABC subunit UvrA, partial [Phycisphaerae bacterium]
STPWTELGESQQLAILHGCGDDWIAIDEGVLPRVRVQWRGFFPAIDRAARANWQFRKNLRGMASTIDCQACKGSRLRDESAASRVNDRTIRDVCAMPLASTRDWFKQLKLSATEKRIAGELLHEIRSRLEFLCDVGLDYVSLNRTASTLSGGESQRIQLASQIGTGLTGVLYVLDEPTIGLHPRDNRRLISALEKLRDLGNTLLLVEHDRELIDAADHVLDFGPQAGSYGGEVTAADSPSGIQRKKQSLTGRYLSGKASIAVPTNRRQVTPLVNASSDGPWLTVHGGRENNLKDIDVSFPLGRFTCVTGVSGSGKSTLVSDIMHKALAARIHRASLVPGGHERISGVELIDKVINIDQSPIGNSPTSNPATYTGVFDLIRELFAKLPTAKIRGYTANRFSFNRPGGRCEECTGMGMTCVEMHFLPDVWVACESCKGRRYVQETLDVQYHEKSIADVLEMRVSEALALFERVPKVKRMLKTLDDVGLGYVQLGQAATTLSGGEAQRVKLAAELGRPSTGKTLYLLDEPTTGLHFDDLGKLLRVLHRLVDMGNTVICVEHNLDVIKTSDWVIDLGPEAGAAGGEILVEGTPERVASFKASHTGAALKPVLSLGPHEEREIYSAEEAAAVDTAELDLGDDIRMPWEEDGRRWHTVDHVDPQGEPVRWDTEMLVWLAETVEGLASFAPTNWNHRTMVEITARKNKQWFAHFLTGGSDLLEFALRVPEGGVKAADVSRLAIPTLDEREDLPIYGQWARAKVRPVGNGWTAIRLALRDFKDFDKRAMKSFLSKASAAYMAEIAEQIKTPSKGKPWKENGKDWHLGQQAMRHRDRAMWKPDLILGLLAKLNTFERDIAVDWNQESSVLIMVPGEKKRFAKIVTNQSKGVRIEVKDTKGVITPAMMDRLGTDGEIRTRPDGAWVLFWLRKMKDVDFKQFHDVWARCRSIADEERLQTA